MPRVDDVLASLQVSSHKCKIMYYTEVLASCDFRSVWYFYFFGAILRLFFTAWVLCKTLNIYIQGHSYACAQAAFYLPQ